jgi:hypothetical protein
VSHKGVAQIVPNQAPYTHAVVMGDLVDSQSARSIEDLYRHFNDAIDDANRSYQKDIASPLTITLGDEFQGLCSSLSIGMDIIRSIRSILIEKSIECRFAVGLTSIRTPMNTEKSWNMMGFGLAETRHQLNNKQDENAYRFQIPDELTAPLLNTIGLSLTLVEGEWTERQKEVLAHLRNSSGSITDHATRLGIAPRTLYKIRSAARMDFYENQWKVVRDALAILDHRYGLA